MLTEEDFARFTEFKVGAMGRKLREIVDDPAYDACTFEEKVKMMIDAQVEHKVAAKIARLNRAAGFKLPTACVEDIVYLPERKISRDRIARYAECGWVEANEVLVIISKSGCGKSFVSQALGNAACRKLHGMRYTRLAGLCEDLNRARDANDGSYYEKIDGYKSVKLLIVDDFLTTPISGTNAVDLFEIMDAREGRAATLIASQLEPNEWYLRIDSGLMADSLLGRTASTARFLDIDGPDMRKYFADKRRKEEGGTN